jgi:hypothetical protein
MYVCIYKAGQYIGVILLVAGHNIAYDAVFDIDGGCAYCAADYIDDVAR